MNTPNTVERFTRNGVAISMAIKNTIIVIKSSISIYASLFYLCPDKVWKKWSIEGKANIIRLLS